ncbi:hypothetical protein [Hymenobacter nivis]|uniref:Uncharacterized protein n=1 Tax=Hymenobacter nivis TaxID=1850093 RepID=A0A502GVN4_9BACT|nr:hypothetical protein [Hymenobacter nivis]TPG65468.1 hypothetical protein EAH73_13435 [Hymenobacter nivis]
MLRFFLAGALVLAVLFGAQAQTGTKNYKRSVRQANRKKGSYYRAGTLKATGAGKRKMEVSRGDYYLAPGMPMPQTDHRHIDSYMGDVPPRKHYAKKPAPGAPGGNSTLSPAKK